ncbi:hypothetical protein [Paenibacillus gansuensis]|uniref:Uncharacterized protein n=1 Tax=Paenibacillus gansuensis TaxID=306542 RepID=A0ABW5PF34_9BACL
MRKDALSIALNQLISNRFNELQADNIAKNEELGKEIASYQEAFLKSMNTQQKNFFESLEQLMAEELTQQCEAFYRAGIRDGMLLKEAF